MPIFQPHTQQNIAEIYSRNVKTLYRVCFSYMKNQADTEDAVSETFCRLLSVKKEFESPEHEKAWLIRVAANICKNRLRQRDRLHADISECEKLCCDSGEENRAVLEAVLNLPERYKSTVYLYYYEGYTTPEISKILKKPQSTVRNYLSEARRLLKEKLEGDF